MFEVIMLVCFGASWPISIIKTIKAKNPVGRSVAFLYLVLIGYIAGCLNKYYYSPDDNIIWLYALNGAMVTVDIILVHYYINLRKKKKI